jgi:2-keto-3-deoxy-L-rhamnonate aldolase RhmA
MRYPPAARRSSGNTGPSGTMARMWDPLAPPGLDYRKSINDNMLMVVMIETVEGVENALEIATTPGVDVVIMGNNDLQQFSGIPITDDRYQDMLTHVRDATYLAGKFWGNAGPRLPKGNVLAPDSRFHQNGPAFDGWVDPKGSPDAGAMPQ